MKKGFTIVEILVVIGIIAVLTVIIFPSINNLKAKNRDTERISDLASLQIGLLRYYSATTTGSFPFSLQDLVPVYTSADTLIDPNGEMYPYVPLTYAVSNKCTYYHLGTVLELPNDQIDSTDIFSSLRNGVGNISSESSGYLYCNGYSGLGLAPGPKNYNVRPQ